jgi:hypothetical protein
MLGKRKSNAFLQAGLTGEKGMIQNIIWAYVIILSKVQNQKW